MAEEHDPYLDDLLKEIKEKEKKSRELWNEGERQLTVAISAYIAPRKPNEDEVDKDNKK
jgi:hypothetical protein